MIKIPYYENSYFCFSNFSAHKILFGNTVYSTTEHAFHAQKFEDESIVDEVKNATSPLEALRIGKLYKSKRKPNWNEIKLDVMYEVQKEKIKQHPDVREALITTGNEEIVEDSPDDDFWGNGKDGNGQNQFGKILMKIREELKTNPLSF